jgi:effector-binding domain-containing protein
MALIFCIFTLLIVFVSMKTLRRILIVILCFALILISIAYLLPKKIHVERSMSINASQKKVFEQINTLRNWLKWSPWLQMDTTMALSFSGPESGIGTSYKWLSHDKNVGTGSVTIISSIPYDSLMVIMDFDRMGISMAKFKLIKENKGTNLIWSLESDLGMNPVSRWFGLFSDHMIGPDLERGLFNLDEMLARTEPVHFFEIIDYVAPAQVFLTIRDTASPVTVSLKLASMYKKLSLFLKSKNLSPTGAPTAVFHNYSSRYFDIEACLPIASRITVADGLNCVEKKDQKAVMLKYFGTYRNISLAYSALDSYIKDNGFVITGPPWEEYVTNPSLEADTSKLQTNIFYPVN